MSIEDTGRTTHTLAALMELRKRILNGDFPGGTRLFEVPLAETLQISRTPIREAMSRLAEEGLLDRLANGGFVVRSFTFADVVDAIELRGVLEGTAARLAAERGAPARRLQEMEEVLIQLDDCFGAAPNDVDFEGYSELNGQFHRILVELSGSAVLQREIDRATRLPFASPSAFLSDRTNIDVFRQSLHVAQEQHRALVSAIGSREGTRAEFIAREHARIARRNLEYVTLEDPDLILRVPGLALLNS
ncbi:Transcriptional regulator GntR family [Pseudorhizobium banfieldiae]|jgi:GntR family transcriptional regulator of vanillate catabolism|uniref:Transcriptional regulator GntR family n=2 Tax=Pseudorhizobium TaxID=1903858 RepID=L0NFS4_9HYPH|nr:MULTISPECIES: GntR family transcriptional regulator [Pseudorhizobium]CAD6603569.1 GntR family transcriptional regulator [Rhizobium sp. Khangiran2]CAD6611204.1 GntR family transcriptional regulator [arsenite-oxidising bacterium NT-25]CAD6616544.1 GntR family transcriptional regulator [Rhizobium sp. TCK]CAD7036125.1 GntR family transcriptional regulator [Pseudorhizobium halotolerans]CCF19729.1 Transcriptional regulator GntR family [Pseudorhizobium banfieldiae]